MEVEHVDANAQAVENAEIPATRNWTYEALAQCVQK